MPAVQENADDKVNGFYLGTDGALTATVDHLPGNPLTYYWYLIQSGNAEAAKHAKYNVAYYYTEAQSIADMNPSNTFQIVPDDFAREFSARLYISNVKNYLAVEKVNEEGDPVNGAKFALYDAKDVTTDGRFDPEKAKTATPYDQAKTATLDRNEGDKISGDGLITFPSRTMHTEKGGKSLLECGTYYLVETSAPEGYEINPTAVKVEVGPSGIYARRGHAGGRDLHPPVCGKRAQEHGPVCRRRPGGRLSPRYQGAAADL